MDFAAEPIMDVTPPQRAAARPASPPADDGPTFDEHLEAAREEPRRESTSQTDEPKANSGIETKPEAPVEQSDASNAAQIVLAAATAPVAPVATSVAVQIAASTPAPQQQQQAQPVTPADASAPTAPTPSTAPASAAPETAPAPVKSAAAPEQDSPGNSGAAQQPTVAAAAGQTLAPTPATQTPVTAEQLPQTVRDAIAATIAPAPAATQQVAVRAPKAAVDQAQARQAPETANATDARPDAPNAKANKVTTAPSVARDAPAITPTPATHSDTAEPTQTGTTATSATQASTHTQHAAADTGAQRAAPAAAQVAREIIRRFDGGNTNFELRLDPPELGRVEVRMEVSRDHRVTAVISADSPQALTELARHARELEQQLQSAGLQLSENGLSFDLRQGAQGGEKQEASTAARGSGDATATPEQTQTQTARPIGFERWRGVRVDMMV